MGFEKFEKGGFRGASENQVTLRKAGTIGISKLAKNEYFEDDQTGAVLYYDEEGNQIGIEPADPDEDPDAYRINDTQGSASLNVESFLKRHSLVPEETTAYEPEWDDEHGFIVVDLDNPKE